MFGKKSKNEATKKQNNDKEKTITQKIATRPYSVGNVLTNTSSSFSAKYSHTTIAQTSSKEFHSTSTIYCNKDKSFPEINKRFSVDAIPFSTASTGYQSPFNRRLNPINLSTRSTNSSTTPLTRYGGETLPSRTFSPSSISYPNISVTPSNSSIIASRTFNRQDRSYDRERNRNPTISASVTRINPVGRNQSESIVPEYNTKGLKRGTVLVINNIKFLQEKEERKGAEADEKNVINMFKTFGFDVQSFRNLKRKDIMRKIIDFRSARSLSKYDISLIIIMSHGSNLGIRGGYTEIAGVDGEGISTEDIVDEFTVEKCPAMQGKPKIFIFQCCRGSAYDVQVDVVPTKQQVKNNADVLIAYSTLPGFVSLRNPVNGSWFIKCICEVFQQHARTHHVEDLLKIVDEKLSLQHPDFKQTSTYENRGFKKCYLNPR